jgi:hypothetical protein
MTTTVALHPSSILAVRGSVIIAARRHPLTLPLTTSKSPSSSRPWACASAVPAPSNGKIRKYVPL